MRRLLAVVVSAVAAFAVLPASPAFATNPPSAPRSPSGYPGVDGVRLYWHTPSSPNGTVSAYRIYRAPADGAATPLTEVSAASPRTYHDATATPATWTYTITAVNEHGESAASPAVTRTVPEPAVAGPVIGWALDGAAFSWGGGPSVAFVPPTDTVEMLVANAASLRVSGVSAAGSPQGARDMSWRVGTTYQGNRLTGGTTYPTRDAFMPADAVELGATLNPCSNSTGSITVHESSFQSDGTPLVFAASFVYNCGGATYGEIRWNATTGLQAITTSHGPLDFGSLGTGVTSEARTVTLHNAGSLPQSLGPATLAGSHPGDFAVGTDTCSATTLQPGATCSIALTASPAASGARSARLTLSDGTAHGERDIGLLAHGVELPPAPAVQVTPGYHAAHLVWNYSAGNSTNGGYRVYRGTAPDSLSLLAEIPPTQRTRVTHVDTGAVPGITYYYAVSALNQAGEGPRGEPVSATSLRTALVYSTDEFSGNGNYSLVIETANALRIPVTPDSADNDMPAVSPDGRLVAYISDAGNADGNYDIWVRPLVGSAPASRVTTGADDDVAPAWSPDGTRLAFERQPASGAASSVWTVPAAGGAAVPVPGTTGDTTPSWSPSGRLLAVSRLVTGPQPSATVAVTTIDGAYRRTVSGGAHGFMPAWSPDGTKLTFLDVRTWAVMAVPAAGGTPVALTPPRLEAYSQKWSPEGDSLVVEGDDGVSSTQLWRVPAAGGTPVALTSWGYTQSFPAIAASAAAYPARTVSPVTGLAATLGTGSVALSWTPPAGTSYVVVRRSDAGGVAPVTPEQGRPVYTGTARSASATGLAQGKPYAFSVFAISAAGDASAPVSRRATTALPFNVNPHHSVLSNLYANGPRYVAKWGPALPAGLVYDVQLGARRQGSTGAWGLPVWSAFRSGTTATSGVVNATGGTTYYLRARIRDAFGNATAWSPVATQPVPYDDRSFAAAGTWSAQSAAGRFAGTIRVSTATNARLTYTAYGSSFTVLADKCATCGQVKIYVDGVYKGTVDTYARTTLTRQAIWVGRFSGISRHTISLVVAGTRGRPAVRIDGLVSPR